MSFNSTTGVYTSPVNNLPLTIGICNYNPVYPCSLTEPYSQVSLEYPAYDNNVFNASLSQEIQKGILAANQAQVALGADETSIELTAAQNANIDKNFTDTISN